MTTETEAEKKPLVIVNLVVENLKRIKAVNITPTGNMVQITGANAQGKSTILESISWALEGLSKSQSEPIRKGQDSARIRLDLGDVIVTRRFSRKKKDNSLISDITVESADGARFPSPQKVLDAMISALTLDPVEFMRMKPKDRFDAVKAFVKGFDFAAADKANDDDYKKRTDVNRRMRDLQGQVSAITIPAVVPKGKIDEAAIVSEIADVGQFNARLERQAEGREMAAREARAKRVTAEGSRRRALELRQQADAHDKEAAAADAEGEALDQKIKDAPPMDQPKDAAAIQARLQEAKATNALYDRMREREALQERLAAAEKAGEALTAAIAARDAKKKEAIAKAEMPIAGLDFGADDLLFNGVPFDQASSAEKLRVSLAIAMANKPRIRVLRVHDGSLLDEDSMKVVADMTKDKGFQCWVEIARSNSKIGIVIEDGSVKAVNDDPADAPEQKDLLT